MAKITEIEGIGKSFGDKLRSAGIGGTAELLEKGCDRKGRKQLSAQSGIDEKQILKWVNRADLSRIRGIGPQYADLLEASGVDTVPELAQRKNENLLMKMEEVNSKKKLVRKMPVAKQVQGWIDQAKALPRIVSY
jgi:predicted flap endonuclease-1-like 5' DNA nuclease